MTAELGLRERKKQEMRRQLAATALSLFAERGFEAVTVADVAAAVNVSEKTVFNYFATKEDLVLSSRAEVEAELLRSVRERAPGESILTAVRHHTLWLAKRLSSLPADRRRAFRQVVQQSPALQTRMRQMSFQSEAELARLLAAETADADPALATVVASVLGVLVRQAFDIPTWSNAPPRPYDELVASIEAAFDLFERGLVDYGVKPAP
jgi:AcrR family transcriptional regulator